MSNPMDALIPPRQTDYALASFPEEEELDGDDMVFSNYTFNTDVHAWICDECEALVANPPGHTAWHERLDKKMTPQ